MSHKIKNPDGSFSEIYYAVFDGEEQITAWRRSIQETRSAFMRRGPRGTGKRYNVHQRRFLTPPKELTNAPDTKLKDLHIHKN